MKYDIKTTNLDLTPEIKEMVDNVMEDLNTFTQSMGASIYAQVEIGMPSLHHQSGKVFYAEINVEVPGIKKVLRAESSHLNLLYALTQAKDEIQIGIKKYKEKFDAKRKKEGKEYKESI